MKAKFKMVDPGALEATLEATFTIDNWRRIGVAIQEQKDAYYGPLGELHRAISTLIERAEKNFITVGENDRG